MQAEEFNTIPVGAEVSFVYKPGGATSSARLSGQYLGLNNGKVSIRVYRTVNYGTGEGYDDQGHRIVKKYNPNASSTYNDQTYGPWEIVSITTI